MLTPEQRVREAEHTYQLSELRRRDGSPAPLQFATYDEFLDWKQRQRASGE